MSEENKLQRGYEEAKDQYKTRKEAIGEAMSYSDKKEDTGEKVADALVKPKEEVRAQSIGESVKNIGISAYESVKETLDSAYESLTGTGGSKEERK